MHTAIAGSLKGTTNRSIVLLSRCESLIFQFFIFHFHKEYTSVWSWCARLASCMRTEMRSTCLWLERLHPYSFAHSVMHACIHSFIHSCFPSIQSPSLKSTTNTPSSPLYLLLPPSLLNSPPSSTLDTPPHRHQLPALRLHDAQTHTPNYTPTSKTAPQPLLPCRLPPHPPPPPASPAAVPVPLLAAAPSTCGSGGLRLGVVGGRCCRCCCSCEGKRKHQEKKKSKRGRDRPPTIRSTRPSGR